MLTVRVQLTFSSIIQAIVSFDFYTVRVWFLRPAILYDAKCWLVKEKQKIKLSVV